MFLMKNFKWAVKNGGRKESLIQQTIIQTRRGDWDTDR